VGADGVPAKVEESFWRFPMVQTISVKLGGGPSAVSTTSAAETCRPAAADVSSSTDSNVGPQARAQASARDADVQTGPAGQPYRLVLSCRFSIGRRADGH
jgi:hypothetical protein